MASPETRAQIYQSWSSLLSAGSMLTDKRRKVYGVVGVIIHPIQNVKKLSCVLCQNTMRSPEVSSFLFGNVFVKFRPLDCLHWNPSLGRSLSFQIEVRPAMQSLQGNVLSIWALKSMLTRIILVTDSPGFRWKPTALLDPVSLKSPPPQFGAQIGGPHSYLLQQGPMFAVSI